MVGEVGRQQGRPVVLYHHNVVLWHVHSGGELIAPWKRRRQRTLEVDTFKFLIKLKKPL